MKKPVQITRAYGIRFLFTVILAVAMALTPLSIMSCDNSHPSELVGEWVLDIPMNIFGNTGMELFKDGTGVMDRSKLLWKVENERLIIQHSSKMDVFNYKVSGSELTLEAGIIKLPYIKKADYEKVIKQRAEKQKLEKKKAEEEGKQAIANVKKGSFSDSRNGKNYKTVTIGSQTWMAENLNYKTENSKCYGEDGKVSIDNPNDRDAYVPISNSEIQANCDKYGRLYDWKTAMKTCPNGWHLPTSDEWETLATLVRSDKGAGTMLKASSGWEDNGNGIDAISFSALPGGNGYGSEGSFSRLGYVGEWWTASEYGNNDAIELNMSSDENTIEISKSGKSFLYSVRCLQD